MPERQARSAGTVEPPTSRVDPKTGTTERLEFFGTGRHKIFGCRYLPAGEPLGGLVICSSLHAEMLTSYRTEVLLARSLSRRGVAVQRFHYRGTGHSDGESHDITFESMREDALVAAGVLSDRAAIANPVFLGVRLGAIVAASAAAQSGEGPVLFWEPLLEGTRFFRDATRAQMMHKLKETKFTDGDRPSSGSADGAVPKPDLDGYLDVLGYQIAPPLEESARARSLVAELGGTPRPVFIAQLGRSKEPRGEYRTLAETLKAHGSRTQIAIIREEPISWFLPEGGKQTGGRDELVEMTTRWLVDGLRSEARR